MDSGRSVHTGPGLQIGTADAARGAATKFGGWRRERGRREHGSAKQSIPTLRCPRRRIRCSASHFPRTRGALRRMAFCAVHCSALVASAVSGGVSTPPRFCGLSCPEAGPEGCSRPDVHAGMLGGSRCDLRAECTCVVTCERARDLLPNPYYFSPYFVALTHARNRPSPRSGSSCARRRQALAALDPVGFGLDDICAQLIGSAYVMADEARPHFLR
jgi:hypothetical protein